MPAVAGHIRCGEYDEAVLAAPAGSDVPRPSPADDFVLDVWHRLRRGGSDMLGANRWDYFAVRCDAKGLTAAERVEMWERVLIVDAMLSEYDAAVAGSGQVH